MKPLVVVPDAQAAAADILRAALAGRAEPYAAGVQTGTRVPAARAPETPHLPYVLVRADGQSLVHLSDAPTTVRVTVWHTGADDAHDLAQLCQGLLLVHAGPVIRGMQPLTGPLSATDPDSGTELSSFTVRAHVRPTVLSP